MLRRQCVSIWSVLLILTFSLPTWAGGREKNLQEKIQAKQRRLSRDKKRKATRYLELSEDEEPNPVEESELEDQSEEQEDEKDRSASSLSLRQSSIQPARPLVSSVDSDDAISYSPSPDSAESIYEMIVEWKVDGRNLFNDRKTIYRCLDILQALRKEVHDSGETTFASEKVERILTCVEKLDHFDREYIQLLKTYQSELIPYLHVLMMSEPSAVDIYDILSGVWQKVRHMKVFTDGIKASREVLSRGWWLASDREDDSSEAEQSDRSGYFESKSTSHSSSRSDSHSESSY